MSIGDWRIPVEQVPGHNGGPLTSPVGRQTGVMMDVAGLLGRQEEIQSDTV